MKKLIVIFFTLLTTLLQAQNISLNSKCGKNLNTINRDLKILSERNKISVKDYNLLMDRIYNSKYNEIANKTYGQILKRAKSIYKTAELKRNKEIKQEEIKRKSALKKMNETIDVYLTENSEVNHSGFPVSIRNKSDREIRAVLGTFILTNLFDEELEKFTIRDVTKIAPLDTHKSYYKEKNTSTHNYNGKKSSKFKVKFIPKEVLFSDELEMNKSIDGTKDIEIVLKNNSTEDVNMFARNRVIILEFKNKTNKNIKAFKGELNFETILGNVKNKIEFTIDDEIQPLSTLEHKFLIDNDYDTDDEFTSTKPEDFIIRWSIKKIIY